jgi:hypothetical protein
MNAGENQGPLPEAMQQQHSVVLLEISSFLLVESDLVRFTLNNGKQPYRIWRCEHISPSF